VNEEVLPHWGLTRLKQRNINKKWPSKLVNQERNTRQVMHGPEMIFVWLTDLGKISNISLDNVRRADNDNIFASTVWGLGARGSAIG
jgi:hypothetical protein